MYLINNSGFVFRYGCSLCLVTGSYSQTARKMVFPIEGPFTLRTPAVLKMGPLTATSATAFENLNRHLKRSITGTKGQAHQILTRFIISQRVQTSPVSVRQPHGLGHVKKLTSTMESVSVSLRFRANFYVDRFYSNGKVFHSFHYGRRLKCASYFAFLDSKNCFVKIKYIFMSTDNSIYCICRHYNTLRKIHDDLSLSRSTSEILDRMSPYFILSKSDLVCNKIDLFTHHALIYKSSSLFYGVRILKNYEHE